MVTSTVEEWKYIDVVEGSEHPYKCSLCPKTYVDFSFKRGVVRTHLLQAHYSAFGAAFDHEYDESYDSECAYPGMDIDACSDGRGEEPGVYNDSWTTDSEDGQEGEEEKKGDGDRSGAGNADTNASASVATAMSWTECKKEDVDDAIALWFFYHLIPFNVARDPFFKEMIAAVSKAGRGYKPPSARRLKSLLTDEKKNAIIKKKKAMINKRKRNRMW